VIGVGIVPEPGAVDPGSMDPMRERAELAGGWLRIRQSQGVGAAEVEFWLPV
jgi:signal transduction histidine kinase